MGGGCLQRGQPSHLPQYDSRHQPDAGPNRTAEHAGAELLNRPSRAELVPGSAVVVSLAKAVKLWVTRGPHFQPVAT